MDAIIITGISSGIGKSTYKLFQKTLGQKYKIIGTSRTHPKYPLDLNDERSIDNFCNLIKQESIAGIIHNAGMGCIQSLHYE